MLSRLFKIDWLLVASSVLLLSVGLLALYSISSSGENFSENVFLKQLLFALFSVAAMFFFAFFDYQYLKNYSTAAYFATLGILLIVLVFGKTIRGTSGWIGVGPFHIQPAEISKLTLIIFLASFISQKRTELGSIVRLAVSLFLSAVMIALVMKQPDFGSAMILAGITLFLTILSGLDKKHIAVLAVCGALAVFVGWNLLAPYQKDRVHNFVNPGNDPRGSGYNVIQSVVAVGSGGLIGKGIGNGSQTQLNFLPEKHTDFIFAMIVEELGFLGSLFIFVVFLVFLYRVVRIARFSSDNFGYLLASGIFIMIFIQAFVNIGMNINSMPVTGIPLPFVSYGGSSLVSVFASVGMLLNIHLKRKSSIFSLLPSDKE